jgi:hypothetical protein
MGTCKSRPFFMEFQAELTHTLSRVPNDLSRLSELV